MEEQQRQQERSERPTPASTRDTRAARFWPRAQQQREQAALPRTTWGVKRRARVEEKGKKRRREKKGSLVLDRREK